MPADALALKVRQSITTLGIGSVGQTIFIVVLDLTSMNYLGQAKFKIGFKM